MDVIAIRIATDTKIVETWAEKLFLPGLMPCVVIAVAIALAFDR